MEALLQYQTALEQTFPSLTTFSDLNWEEIAGEYLVSYDERPSFEDFVSNFPSYLQHKADEGDCPPYLFELAYFELAQLGIQDFSAEDFPKGPGVHLNPSALFLELEFDVVRMLKESTPGKPVVHEKDHVVCLYQDLGGSISLMELNQESLEILQKLEDQSRPDRTFLSPRQMNSYTVMKDAGLILEGQ